jgi:N-hydroxyarylamine O-acetyltransferase
VDGTPFGTMLQILEGHTWRNIYSFDLCHVCQGDIEYGNHFTATHPESIFSASRVAVLPVPNGMTTLFNYKLKAFIDGEQVVQTVQEGQAYLDALKIHFGIDLGVPYERLLPLKHSAA